MFEFLRLLVDSFSAPRCQVTASPSLISLAIPFAPETTIDDRLARRFYRQAARALLAHPRPVLDTDGEGRAMTTRPAYLANVLWAFPPMVFDRNRRRPQGSPLDALIRRIGYLHSHDRRFHNRFLNGVTPNHRVMRHNGPPDMVFAYCGEQPFPVSAGSSSLPMTASWCRTEGGCAVTLSEEPLRIEGYDDPAAPPFPAVPAAGAQSGGMGIRLAGSARHAPLVLDRWFGDGSPAAAERGWIDIDFAAGTASGDGLHILCTAVPDGRAPGQAVWRCTAADAPDGDRSLLLSWTIPSTDIPAAAEAAVIAAAPADRRPGPALRATRIPPVVATPEAGTILLSPPPIRQPPALEATGLVVPLLNPRGIIARCEVALDDAGMPIAGGNVPTAVELAVFRESGAALWWRWPGEKWRQIRKDDPDDSRRALAGRLRPPPPELGDTVAAVLALPRPVPALLPSLPAVLGHGPGDRADAGASHVRFQSLDGCGLVEQGGRRTSWGTLNLSRKHLLLTAADNDGLAIRLLGRAPALMLDAGGQRIVERLTVPGDPRTLVLTEGRSLLVGSFEVTYRRKAA